jgi:hypothetical protein
VPTQECRVSAVRGGWHDSLSEQRGGTHCKAFLASFYRVHVENIGFSQNGGQFIRLSSRMCIPGWTGISPITDSWD